MPIQSTLVKLSGEKLMSKMRTKLLLEHPFFGVLAMHLVVKESPKNPDGSWAIPTMATDGTYLYYSPDFIQTLTEPELMGVIIHEVMHCAFYHMFRRQNRNPEKWNVACDFVINHHLKDEFAKEGHNIVLPKDVLYDPQYAGMSSEQVYAKLPDYPPDKMPGGGKLCVTGYFMDASGEGEEGDSQKQQAGASAEDQIRRKNESDWQIAVEQAVNQAKQAGKMPGSLDRTIDQVQETKTDWRMILRRFIEHTVPHDQTWAVPNRRFVQHGIYLPGTLKENTPPLVIGVDTSGSITEPLLQIFANEVATILKECKPEKVTVVYCDASVNHVDVFEQEDELVMKMHGGGGTAFQPVFDYVKDKYPDPPAALIYFTDLYGPAPEEPEYPVLWVTTEASGLQGFFGETVTLSEWD